MYVSKTGLKSEFTPNYLLEKSKNNYIHNVQNNVCMKLTPVPVETFKAYNNIECNKLKIDNFNILIDNDYTEPVINIERITDKETVIPKNKGLDKVYELTLKNQFHDSKSYNDNSELNYYEFESYMFFSKCFCKKENFTDSLSQIKKDFIPEKLGEKYIKEALELAPTALYIDSKNAQISSPIINDKNLSIEDYKNLIMNITSEDVKDYHENLMQKSKINLTIVMSEEFYNKNKKEIDETLAKNYKI